MRIDVFLTERGLAASRTEAKNLVLSGAVTVAGKKITKPSYSIDATDIAEVVVDHSLKKYVSRGGLKLEGALLAFSVDPSGRRCIDVGASTGGFTDCLLQHGAESVIAVDSGTLQLSEALRRDKRVISVENYNARYLSEDDLPYKPTLAVMDVSFISATYIIAPLFGVLAPKSDFICLIKPQFEVGREHIGKGGVVKDKRQREVALGKVTEYAKSVGFEFMGSIVSPIEGGDGNVEYLAHFKKDRE